MENAKKLLKLNYLYGGEVVYQPGECLNPRRLTDYECVFIISGTVTYIADGKKLQAPAGSIILSVPGTLEQYIWDTVQPTRHAFFHFSADRMPSYWPAPASWPHIIKTPDPLIISLFRHILGHIYEHRNWPAEAPEFRDGLLLQNLIDTCLESHTNEIRNFSQTRPEPVRQALKWMRQQIDDNPCDTFSLADISRAAKCSPKHLCRVFRSSVGYSPAQTGTLMRLQLAIAMLARSNLNIKEIGLRCGFENPHYFSRCFSKVFGRSPSAVRADIDAGLPPPPGPLPVDTTPRIHW
ncbi:helix-turn-helix domain-containing protein [Pontiella sulfatireligans]|uniref:Arabinose operon regulatory protein n=1 Tax=Pontiella sulfatireligans TaxID=2750658 RepID=A0A6C2UKJ0_9BACT|nr:AraC family transcriptional regulator [Pontiella sulfatireligans]VGO20403.1 Arabinose operon regulatory protein [Pontiella sulfatireligans]